MANHNPYTPTYKAEIKLHMPADAVWERDVAYNTKRVVETLSPDTLWQRVCQVMCTTLGMESDLVIYGLFLNLINKMPEDIRSNFIMGIANGLGASFVPEDGKPILQFSQFFEPLNLDGEKVTENGLILPNTNELLVP